MSTRKSGELKKFFDDKGFGFIKSNQGDVFFHVSDSQQLNTNALQGPITLSYEEDTDARSGRTKAINVAIEE